MIERKNFYMDVINIRETLKTDIFFEPAVSYNVFDIHIRTKDKVVIVMDSSTFMVHKNRVRRLINYLET